MKRLLLSVLLFLATSGAWADVTGTASLGSVTVTEQSMSGVRFLTVDYLTSTSGGCTVALADVYGVVLRATINPDGGATSPTASYNMTLADVDGFDVLCGLGANLSASATTSFACLVEETTSDGTQPIVVFGALTMNVTNAGSQNGGILRLYLKP